MNLKNLSEKLFDIFGTDQRYYLKQLDDGTYRKITGLLTPSFIENKIQEEESLAIYQRNIDSTVKWICFDFDVLKKHINQTSYENATVELLKVVKNFVNFLNKYNISNLIEFSGNRGIHIWITFDKMINYQVAYNIMKIILDHSKIQFDKTLVGLDLFPKSNSPSDGVGSGVKMPLSKHKKSNAYSYFLKSIDEIENFKLINHLDQDFVNLQNEILNNHKNLDIDELEKELNVFIDLSITSNVNHKHRINEIEIEKEFNIDELFKQWENYEPLEYIVKKIKIEKEINHDIRLLIVGLLSNVKIPKNKKFSSKIIHEVFKKSNNYNQNITENAINKLSSYYFPSQEQIENITKKKFKNKKMSIDNLIKICIPNFCKFKDATFEISCNDILTTAIAELNYLFINDEVQIKYIIDSLSRIDTENMLHNFNNYNIQHLNFYSHLRNEKKIKKKGTSEESVSTRKLITLDVIERLLTSTITKQIDFFLGFEPNPNSYGYKLNKNYKGGFIYEHWLFLWIKYISNLSTFMDDEYYANYYILKTDVKNYYDQIPHENLKRVFLGDGNKFIKNRKENLSQELLEKYQSNIETLMNITEGVLDKNIGLPQGPAYARYLAEIYLNELDIHFDEKIKANEIVLYQRYVDDIFIIVDNKSKAEDIKKELNSQLDILGLSINEEKTLISQIGNFTNVFDKYRAQSKYAVDRISKNFDISSDHQKELAISEFTKLLTSENCKEDLSFIFSHLADVDGFDEIKRQLALETLTNKLGRGSLYKHIFNFILDDDSNWHILKEIDKLDILQSEVLISTFISFIETKELKQEELLNLLESLLNIFSKSDLINEHLMYLHLNFNLKIQIENFSKRTIVKCLSICDSEELYITDNLINYINTELNAITDLYKFIEILYPLCINSRLSDESIMKISSIFYAKMASSTKNDELSTDKLPLLKTENIVKKFYYIISLFTLSDTNKSIDLIKNVWKYCTYCFNQITISNNSYLLHDWLRQIDKIKIDDNKAKYFMVSLVDGSPYRGLFDHNKLFIKYHHSIILYLVFEKKILDSNKISYELEKLKNKSDFYNWILDNKNVNLFPNNSSWFEKNISFNNTVMLQKENKILIQKPTKEFISTEINKNNEDPFSEIIINYNLNSLCSINEVLDVKSICESLELLIKNITKKTGKFPNIFTNEKILVKGTFTPFTEELLEQNTLIFHNSNDDVTSHKNDFKNFIDLFLKKQIEGKNSLFFKRLNEKYIQNLDSNICLVNLLRQLLILLYDFDDSINDFLLDILISDAIYSQITNLTPNKRVEFFINQYEGFNKYIEDKHLFTINKTSKVNDNNLILFFDTIKDSFKILIEEISLSNILNLKEDINSIFETILKIENIIQEYENKFTINNLEKAKQTKFNIISKKVVIDLEEYFFNDVKIFNLNQQNLEVLSDKHFVQINNSEHIYYTVINKIVYLVGLPQYLSKIYISIEKRFDLFINEKQETTTLQNMKKNKLEFKLINNYNNALNNIMVSQDIKIDVAEKYLNTWLQHLSSKFHKPLINLIAAHVIMTKDDIDKFIDKYHYLIENKNILNPFLIKMNHDNNGTHRVLIHKCKEGKNTRIFDELGPSQILPQSRVATIIVDNIISGTQVINSLKHYLKIKEKKGAYFPFQETEIYKILELDKICICTILYTKKGISYIEEECKKIFNKSIEIEVLVGRNIGEDSTFETSSKLGTQDKEEIIELLQDRESMKNLLSHLKYYGTINDEINYWKDKENILNTNLVTRYKSLPKNGFSFLYYDLKNIDCHKPFLRVLEKNEI